MRTMIVVLRRGCLVPVAMIVAVLALATSASAVFTPGGPQAGTGAATELIMRGTGPGQGVTGFIARTNNPFDPLSGYPATDPTEQGSIRSTRASPGSSPPRRRAADPTLLMYCIDIRTLTQGGYGYTLGDWDAANVPLVGYIGRILNSYYPTTTAPASLTDVNQKAAAVQAAIWFFSDKYVLSTSSPLHDTVAGIVAQVIAAGPLRVAAPAELDDHALLRQWARRLAARAVHRDCRPPATPRCAPAGRRCSPTPVEQCRWPTVPRWPAEPRSGCGPRGPARRH